MKFQKYFPRRWPNIVKVKNNLEKVKNNFEKVKKNFEKAGKNWRNNFFFK